MLESYAHPAYKAGLGQIRDMGENPYLANGVGQLRVELKRIERLQEPNRAYALEFKTWMEMQNKSLRTIAKRLDEAIFVLQVLGKRDAKNATKQDIEQVVTAINNAKRRDGKGIAPVSKGKIKLTLRVLFKFLLHSKTYPEIVEDVKPDRAKNSLLPSDMLSEADIEKMINSCKNPLDKAAISLLWSGMRVGELLSLRISDVKTEEGEVDVVVVGKTGQRTVSLMNPTYLLTYLKQMRNNAAPTAPLFVKLQNGTATEEWLSYEALKKKLRDIRDRVPELKGRRVYPHLFRHSFASFLAGQNFNPEIMRRYFGWASNQMAVTYVHLNDQAVKDAIRTLGKREVSPSSPDWCPRSAGDADSITSLPTTYAKGAS